MERDQALKLINKKFGLMDENEPSVWFDSVNKFLLSMAARVRNTVTQNKFTNRFQYVREMFDRYLGLYKNEPVKYVATLKISKQLYENLLIVVYSETIQEGENDPDISLPNRVVLDNVDLHNDLLDTTNSVRDSQIYFYDLIKSKIEDIYNNGRRYDGGSRRKSRKLTSKKRRTKGKNGFSKRMRSRRLRH
jgi:hypothetical protein